jgi:putative hydrolase
MNRSDHSNFCTQATTLTGISETLAQRALERGIDTLEDLELAAYDGRLSRIPGFGAKRILAVRAGLDRHLSHPPRAAPMAQPPTAAALLLVDAEYRRLAARGELPLVAPRRFNPNHHAWLPVWHISEGEWTFTVMHSNTARAFGLGKRRDWVIIVYERDGEDDHCTVVTEHAGPLQGRRVIRGRERECARHYRDEQRVTADVHTWVHTMCARLQGGAINKSAQRSPRDRPAAAPRRRPHLPRSK